MGNYLSHDGLLVAGDADLIKYGRKGAHKGQGNQGVSRKCDKMDSQRALIRLPAIKRVPVPLVRHIK